jgi:hypothetical protein
MEGGGTDCAPPRSGENRPCVRRWGPARIRADGFVDPCIRPLVAKPPSGPDWVHEIKHDGYRTRRVQVASLGLKAE